MNTDESIAMLDGYEARGDRAASVDGLPSWVIDWRTQQVSYQGGDKGHYSKHREGTKWIWQLPNPEGTITVGGTLLATVQAIEVVADCALQDSKPYSVAVEAYSCISIHYLPGTEQHERPHAEYTRLIDFHWIAQGHSTCYQRYVGIHSRPGSRRWVDPALQLVRPGDILVHIDGLVGRLVYLRPTLDDYGFTFVSMVNLGEHLELMVGSRPTNSDGLRFFECHDVDDISIIAHRSQLEIRSIEALKILMNSEYPPEELHNDTIKDQPSEPGLGHRQVDNGSLESPSRAESPNGEGQRDDDEEDTITYPEGGLSSWLAVFGSWCALTAGLGLLNTIAPLQTYTSRHQLSAYPESTVAWIFSLQLFLVFFCSIQIGPLFDAVGPRLLVLAGSACLVVSMLLMGLCTEYWHFILDFSILAGIGGSLIFTPSIASIGHFFNRRRAFATGIAMTGPSAGGIIFPLVFRAAYPQYGFAWATRILGFIMLALFILANIFLRSRLPRRKPTLKDCLPDFKIFKDGDGSFALCTAGLFLMELALFVPLAYITSYSITNGLDQAFSYQIIAILNAASVLGRAVPGFIADKIGRYNTMIACLFLCMLINLCLWLPVSLLPLTTSSVKAAVIAYAILFGFASGSNLGLTGPCVGQLCKTSEYGRYYATSYTLVSFATLIGIPIGGKLVDVTGGGYWGLIVFTGVGYAASTACMIGVRVVKVGWGWKAVF